jgi:hypothetical protein
MRRIVLLDLSLLLFFLPVMSQVQMAISSDLLGPIGKSNNSQSININAVLNESTVYKHFSFGGGKMINLTTLYSLKSKIKIGVDMSYWNGPLRTVKREITPFQVSDISIRFNQIQFSPVVEYHDTLRNIFIGGGVIIPILNSGTEFEHNVDYDNNVYSQAIWKIKNQPSVGQKVYLGYYYKITTKIHLKAILKANFLIAKPVSSKLIKYSDLSDRTLEEVYPTEILRNRTYNSEVSSNKTSNQKSTIVRSQRYSQSSISFGIGLAWQL